ncbi:MAG: DVU0150 family protein [Deltaproteobacteria bacterium]|jgi:heme/copper-type cytochrome/quinol oxidase subunit 2
MRKHFKKIYGRMASLVISGTSLMLLLPALAMAAGGGKIDMMVIVADTRGLPAWEAWWANLYNESHLYFAVVTVVLIPIIGVVFGTVADFFMKFLGLDLEHRELAEH